MAVAFAVGTLTAAGNAANTETVTVGGKVYTFQDTLTNVDGNVKVGADAETSLANLYNAINLGAGAGTAYAAATVANPGVVATAKTATTLVVKARVPGTVGNHIPSTETGGSLSWGAATLASGTGSIDTDLRALLTGSQVNAAVHQQILEMVDPQGDE